MSVGMLTTALIIIFVFSIVVLAAELLFVFWRRRSSPPPLSGDAQHPDHSSTTNELLCFFCLKAQTRIEPSETPTQKPGGGSSPDDPEIDVFKLLETTGPSRVLCTIKEEEREDVESTSISRVDSVEITAANERVSLQACLESDVADEIIALKIEDTKSVFSSPCDSPMFFTPVGSPSRDGTTSELVSPVAGNRGGHCPVKGSYVG